MCQAWIVPAVAEEIQFLKMNLMIGVYHYVN